MQATTNVLRVRKLAICEPSLSEDVEPNAAMSRSY
jgi:hypothetical protein